LSFTAEKQGAIFPTWKTRFFLCSKVRREIMYWSDQASASAARHGAKPKGVITVAAVRRIETKTDARGYTTATAKISDPTGRIYALRTVPAVDMAKLEETFGDSSSPSHLYSTS
jgi:hypothetical protein